MTCHRRYLFTFGPEPDHSRVLSLLEDECDRLPWFTDPRVTGHGLGVLQAEFQVSARDQWFAHKRAMDLMERAAWPHPVPTPTWEVALPPHDNRGRNRKVPPR